MTVEIYVQMKIMNILEYKSIQKTDTVYASIVYLLKPEENVDKTLDSPD